MVFNFIESGINLFDDTFNTIKSLFADVATQAAVNALSNRVTAIENTTLRVTNSSPSYTPKVRLGGYTSSNNTYFYIDWARDEAFNNFYRIQIKASTPYAVVFFIKESGMDFRRLFTFNITSVS